MDLWNVLSLGTGLPLNAFFGDTGLFSNPQKAWDNFKNGRTNDVNKEIADENLSYQQERNAIEDARYQEETAYNRMFAEDERDYQRAFAEEERDYARALQQQIFEREDTAIERQANSLSKMGINPLSYTMQGLGAGQVVPSASAPSGIGVPSASARGGSALHNDFRMIDQGVMSSIAPILSFISGIGDVMSGSISRDGLRAQRDGQILENQSKAIDNLIRADENDIRINKDGTLSLLRSFGKKKQDFNEVNYMNANASAERNERENVFQNDYGTHDNSSQYERILTDIENQTDRAGIGVKNKDKSPLNTAKKVLIDTASRDLDAIKNTFSTAKDWFTDKKNKFTSWYKKHSMSASDMEKAYSRRY